MTNEPSDAWTAHETTLKLLRVEMSLLRLHIAERNELLADLRVMLNQKGCYVDSVNDIDVLLDDGK